MIPISLEKEFGDILFTLVGIAQRLGINTEQALRISNSKFEKRFKNIETLARERQLKFSNMDLPELDALWNEVKKSEQNRSSLE